MPTNPQRGIDTVATIEAVPSSHAYDPRYEDTANEIVHNSRGTFLSMLGCDS